MSLVPESVLVAMRAYYTDYPGCAGRSVHRYAREVSRRFEEAREGFACFLGASDAASVVFLRNATEAINLVAQGLSWSRGDRVLVTDQEHNSNLVAWQRLRDERGVRLEVLPLPSSGEFDLEALDRQLARGVRLVSVFHTSNLDGRSLPVREIAELAHDRGALSLFDGCQSAPHRRVDFDRLGADFYAVSAHKMLGPTGTGMLIGRAPELKKLRPLSLGGETVEWTTLREHRLRNPPYRFEAGLQNYAGILGAHEGLRYLERIGLDTVEAAQRRINDRVTRGLRDEERVHVLGPPDPGDRPSVFGFTIDGVDPHDAAVFLDEGWDVLVRSGMHCVHSWYERRALPGSVRASFYFYNDARDADALIEGVREMIARIPNGSIGRGRATRAPIRPKGRPPAGSANSSRPNPRHAR